MYKFIVHKDDFDVSVLTSGNKKFRNLTSITSVNQLKLAFYSLLSKIGELIQIDSSNSKDEIESLCKEENAIYVAVHGTPPEGVKCKFLSHSLGCFMLTGGFLGGWEFRDATINIVTSEKQALQMKKKLKKACPNITVITPSISNEVFHTHSDNEKSKIIKKDKTFELIYSGRFISNKGIAQLVRSLNIWPTKNTHLTLIGDFEPNFFIYQSNATHNTFKDFFSREIIQRSRNLKINVNSAVDPSELKKFYWNSDCFVYPSFHEDENFGLAPREAMLCGIPSVVTDFCGLGQLRDSKGGIIKTYPTLGGVRYSLFELSNEIDKIRNWSNQEKKDNRFKNTSFIKEECNQEKVLLSLLKVLESFKIKTNDSPPVGGWRSKARFESLVKKNKPFFENAIINKNKSIPQGLYVDGTGYIPDGKWFSEAHFLKAIQGIYTTLPIPPKVKKGDIYRGFWRVALWSEEKAIVEFGFPGPRIKRYKESDWIILLKTSTLQNLNEVVFMAKNGTEMLLIQDLVELGYLVPDVILSTLKQDT